MVTRDRWWALRMMADGLNVNKDSILQILHEDLWKRKICPKYVPRRLKDEQKQRRLTSCQNFLKTCQYSLSFLDCIFSFLTWKLPSMEGGFRMLKTENREGRTEHYFFGGLCRLLKNMKRFYKCIQVGGDYFE
jgi:hypothetical protein